MMKDEMKGRLGFGCMRLPLKDNGEIDYEQFNQMVDEFIQAGFNYFDVARPYHHEKAEEAVSKCLTSRYPRSSYLLADKLSTYYFETSEDIPNVIDSQLELCGVDYFDFYLMHALDWNRYLKYKECKAFEVAKEYKKEGKIKHIGFSFHDSAEVLDKILSEQKDNIEFVQLQFNYIDYEDEKVQSRLCYEVCLKYNIPVTVMEPIKGGKLINLPSDAKKILDGFNDGSYASFALRYVWSFDNIQMVLSGMSNLEQLRDNLHIAKDLKPLTNQEHEGIKEVVKILNSQESIPCTACSYCVDGCPANINIPKLFEVYNGYLRFEKNKDKTGYDFAIRNHGKPSDCFECGQCENVCPQHIEIRKYLKDIANIFDK